MLIEVAEKAAIIVAIHNNKLHYKFKRSMSAHLYADCTNRCHAVLRVKMNI